MALMLNSRLEGPVKMAAVRKSGGAAVARKRKTIVAAISGGVDSAVAAALGAPPHNEVVDAAVFMSNWTNTSGDNDKPATVVCYEQDERDARQVAAHLNIPVLRRLNFAAEYWVQVFEPYVTALSNMGETGNPDISCNRYIKFGALKDQLDRIYHPGDYTLITGHYARLWRRKNSSDDSSSNDDDPDVPGSVQCSCSSVEIDWLRQWMTPADNDDTRAVDNLLLQAADATKDQSYFLSTCQAPALTNVHFPIGDFPSKSAVRAEAVRLGLPNAHKPDSVGLCFVPERNRKNNNYMTMLSRSTAFRTFLSEYLPVEPARPVQFVDVDTNQVVGQTDQNAHAHLYTRGQGAKLGGTVEKYFCVSTNATTNTVTVCRGTHHPALYSQTLRVESIVWWTGRPPPPLTHTSVTDDRPSSLRVLCRTRHLVPLVPATIVDHHTVRFDAPVRAVTPGQYAVFYVGVVCLGGGKIVAYE
jgi:tRNA-5-taurinomethyluridine 2-sulfurtransferase